MTEIELIEKTAVKVGMTSLLNHGAASCVYSEGCNGITQEHLVAFAREVALHCVAALAHPPRESGDAEDAARYRWLRSIDSATEWNRVGHYAADALDKIIDAARTAEGGKHG